jgi:branched-chain amino acid transport system ATP-binding protein
MLEVNKINAGYGPITVIHDISLTVSKGEIVVILGPNGAGKSTLIRTIGRLMYCDPGNIAFEGKDITKLTTEQVVRMGMIQVPEGRRLFKTLTVYENLFLGLYFRYRSLDSKKREVLFNRVYELLPVLHERSQQMAGTLSGGEQQMLAIGRALMAEPKLMLMDEPFLGLAPLVIKNICTLIEQLREQGMTILMVEQNARASLKLSRRAYLLELGRIVAEKKAQELKDDEYVRTVYLGE